MTEQEATVWSALRHGAENARTQRELAVLAGLPLRTVQACIEAMRRHGMAICSGSQGCWKAKDADELARSNRLLHSHLKGQYRTLRACQMTERRMRAEEQGVVQPELWRAA